ncbi:Ubiquitin carboxyl-terminal hydrolase 48 [Allomyces arbusculus]|nr:Ubiquitin carboxyl-terminal hydrolase 48 [Allomyces arbusculus]
MQDSPLHAGRTTHGRPRVSPSSSPPLPSVPDFSRRDIMPAATNPSLYPDAKRRRAGPTTTTGARGGGTARRGRGRGRGSAGGAGAKRDETPSIAAAFRNKQEADAWRALEDVVTVADLRDDHLAAVYRAHPDMHRVCVPPAAWIADSTDLVAAGAAGSTEVPTDEDEPVAVLADDVELKDGFDADSEKTVLVIRDSSDEDDDDTFVADSDQGAKRQFVEVPASAVAAPSSSTGSAAGPKLPCNKRQCQMNPNCLLHLGLAEWFRKDAKTRFVERELKKFGAHVDPTLLLAATTESDPHAGVGLVNLGATCYINSLLQVLYSDVTFRTRVYQHASASPLLAQLGRVFAFLQQSHLPTYAPRELVQYLEINPGIQQDAQEFGKLLLQVIEEQCPAFDQPMHLGGTSKYVTECQGCGTATRSAPSRFHELVLTPAARLQNTVKGMLDNLFSAERMTDSNQVQCTTCGCKQDVDRRMEVDKLGNVLCLQVSRFAFDPKTMTKKKNQHSIRIPHQLAGMAAISGDWVLTGMVMHKGTSADYGHYIAHVRPRADGPWLCLDDDKCMAMPDPPDPLGSTQAYLLFYTRAELVVHPPPVPEPPQIDALAVQMEVDDYLAKRRQSQEQIDQVVEDFGRSFTLRRDMFAQLQLRHVDEPCAYIPTAYLEQVFTFDPLIRQMPPLDMTAFQCQHHRLDPRVLGQVKRVALAAAHKYTQPVGAFLDHESGPCRDCVAAVVHDHQQRRMGRSAFDDWDTAAHDGDPSAAWAPKAWAADVNRTRIVSDPNEQALELYCQHGKLAPEPQRIAVSDAQVALLADLYPHVHLPRMTETVCPDCADVHAAMQASLNDTRQQAARELAEFPHLLRTPSLRDELPVVPDDYVLVEGGFVESWRAWVNEPDSATRPRGIDGTRLLCEHGKLHVDPRAKLDRSLALFVPVSRGNWERIAELFPAESDLVLDNSFEVCAECRVPWLIQTCGNFELEITIERALDMASVGATTATGRKRRRADKTEVLIKITETLRDAKMSLIEFAGVYPMDQRLFFNGVELTDISATILQLDLYSGCVLTLAVDQARDTSPDRRGERAREVGFTGLLQRGRGSAGETSAQSFVPQAPLPSRPEPVPDRTVVLELTTDEKEAEEDMMSMLMDVDADLDAPQVPCPTCTFLNSAFVQVCEVCENAL